jgi:DNA-binding HxlR family transcriptional regulator
LETFEEWEKWNPEEQKEDFSIPSVTKVFKACCGDVRILILMKLMQNGAQKYSDLKDFVGMRSKTESGKFAFHLRKLWRAKLLHRVRPKENLSRVAYWDLTEEGKMVGLMIEMLIRPNSPLMQSAQIAPALVQAMRKVQDSMNSVNQLYLSIPTALEQKPRFAPPRAPLLSQKQIARILQDEDIKRRKAQADAGYYEG